MHSDLKILGLDFPSVQSLLTFSFFFHVLSTHVLLSSWQEITLSLSQGSPVVRRRRPYPSEYTGSLSTSEVKQKRARVVLALGDWLGSA